MPPDAAPSASIPHDRLVRAAFLNRRELFCQHYATGAGGAEAVRRSGYSAKGAKQRACVLLQQPEIRLRIEALRAERRDAHQSHLAEAVDTVDGIIQDALQNGKSAVALRAVEFKLKLLGVIGDKRISHYSYSPSPDADLEDLEPNREEEFDGLPGFEYHLVRPDIANRARAAAPASEAVDPAEAVTGEPAATVVTMDDPAPGQEPTNAAKASADAVAEGVTAPETVTMDDPPAGSKDGIAPSVSSVARRRHIPLTVGVMTCDDHPAADLDDLPTGPIAIPPALVPECRPS